MDRICWIVKGSQKIKLWESCFGDFVDDACFVQYALMMVINVYFSICQDEIIVKKKCWVKKLHKWVLWSKLNLFNLMVCVLNFSIFFFCDNFY